jgi:hypothetical protein
MAFLPGETNRDETEISLLLFFFAARQAGNSATRRSGDFVLGIRAELPASVEKSAVSRSRTNVVQIGGSGSLHCKPSLGSGKDIAGSGKDIALHTSMSGMDARVRDSAAGSIIGNLTRSLAELFFVRMVPRGR